LINDKFPHERTLLVFAERIATRQARIVSQCTVQKVSVLVKY